MDMDHGYWDWGLDTMDFSDKNTFSCDINVIGDSEVGKSSILCQYMNGYFEEFPAQSNSIVLNHKLVEIDGKKISTTFWDFPGVGLNRHVRPPIIQDSKGIILVYDITNEDSFDNILGFWTDKCTLYAPEAVKFLIGNKCES